MQFRLTATLSSLVFYTFAAKSVFCACATVSPAERVLLLKAIRTNFQIDSNISLRLTSDEVVNEQCFRKISVEGRSSFRTWSLNLFLSPDHRFISSDLLRVNPSTSPDSVFKYVPELGSKNPTVTVTVFSGFQCSSCRGVTDTLEELVRHDKSHKLKIEFRNLPHSNDAWAFAAAIGAACAEIQSDDAFWKMHDRIFANQQDITTANINDKLLAYAKEIPSLDKGQFETCLEGQDSIGLVFRDVDLAAKCSIRTAPAILINGKLVTLSSSESQIRKLLSSNSSK